MKAPCHDKLLGMYNITGAARREVWASVSQNGLDYVSAKFQRIRSMRFISCFCEMSIVGQEGSFFVFFFPYYSLRHPGWSKPCYSAAISIGCFSLHCGRQKYVGSILGQKYCVLKWHLSRDLHSINQGKLNELCWLLEGGKCSFQLLSRKRKKCRAFFVSAGNICEGTDEISLGHLNMWPM